MSHDVPAKRNIVSYVLSTAYYTDLYPKRSDVTGTADQAYNLTPSGVVQAWVDH